MKIQILKETNIKDEVYYWVCMNGVKGTCHSQLEDAEKVFEKLINKKEPTSEIIKEEEI